MNDLRNKIILAVIIFFLVAFGAVQLRNNVLKAAENERLTDVNASITDTLATWRDSATVLGTALSVATTLSDSLAQRTGPIQWHTRTIRVDGRVDTVEVATVEIDTQTVEIPTEIAEEIEACRVLVANCEQFRQTADSTFKWYATSIDSLTAQIDHLSQKPFRLGVFGVNLPLPTLNIGYSLIYSMNPCKALESRLVNDHLVTVTHECQRWQHGPSLSVSWEVWGP